MIASAASVCQYFLFISKAYKILSILTTSCSCSGAFGKQVFVQGGVDHQIGQVAADLISWHPAFADHHRHIEGQIDDGVHGTAAGGLPG